MEAYLMKGLQLIAALAFLVVVHEFGHYIFARIFGIKVEKFYLFFNPWFTVCKWKPKQKAGADPNKTTWRDTEYGIGWLPLGGYCKIAGMIDESLDTDQMKQEPQPWEFRTKPAWQRLFVMIGGVLFNFILAIIIYAGIALHWGMEYVPFENAYEGFDFSKTAQEVGFRNGDVPYRADGRLLDASKGDFMYKMASANTVTVIRGHKDTINIRIPSDFLLKLNDDGAFMAMRLPVYIDRLVAGEGAAKAGMKEGDRIIAVDTIPTPTLTELTPALKQFADTPTEITLIRDGKEMQLTAVPNKNGKLGFQLSSPENVFETVKVRYNLFQSVPKGWEIGTSTLSNYVNSMKYVASSEGLESLGGFGAIGNMFPDRWNWLSFWQIAAFLSVALAFMNILPIPGLDGGHVMFLIYEMIARKPAPEKVVIGAQYVGMAFLLLLLLYANGNDIFKAFVK